jgi:hypothetical protein
VCATTPAFVAALALLMLKQRESRGVCLALVPVIAGLVLATGAEPSFDALGFTAAVAATVLRALKTVLQVGDFAALRRPPAPCHRLLCNLVDPLLLAWCTLFLAPLAIMTLRCRSQVAGPGAARAA